MQRKYLFVFLIILLGIALGYSLFIKKGHHMKNFSKAPISSELRRDMIHKNIWSTNCPVSLERLNLLRVSYVDFDGNEHDDGEIIVFDVVADHVLAIFRELYAKKFPIANISLMNRYDGNDEKSMLENNSSSFNCRTIKDSSAFSIHAYGLAIDINPQQNPYLITKYDIGKVTVPVYPPAGMEYLNRRNVRAGMVESVIDDESRETVVDLMNQHGFTIWGGNWNDPIDWQHFQLTRSQAETLSGLSYEDGVKLFDQLTTKKAAHDN